MPYAVNSALPMTVRHALPLHAQEIYRVAYNNAFETYRGSPRWDEIVHRIAWAEVKKRYIKRAGAWFDRSSPNVIAAFV